MARAEGALLRQLGAVILPPALACGPASPVVNLASPARDRAPREPVRLASCQVFSTYETLRAPKDPAPLTRGVHSIPLVNDGRRLWIAALARDNERVDNPMPPSRKEQDP